MQQLYTSRGYNLMLQEDSYLFFLEQIVSEMEKLYLTIIEINKK